MQSSANNLTVVFSETYSGRSVRSVSCDVVAAALHHVFYTPHPRQECSATKPTRDYTLCCADENRHEPGEGKLDKEDCISESTENAN